jgi:hypothetical protein
MPGYRKEKGYAWKNNEWMSIRGKLNVKVALKVPFAHLVSASLIRDNPVYHVVL